MATNLQAVRDDNVYWMTQPYGVAIGKDYDSYEEALAAQMAVVMNDDGAHSAKSDSAKLSAAQSEINSDKQGGSDDFIRQEAEACYQYKSPSVSDASVGGNDVINPHSAFALDDDIVHDVYTTKNSSFGMGRCYSEIYDSKQAVLYLTMGIPKYNNLTKWLKNATNKELSELNDNGNISIWTKLGNLISGGVKLAIELPWLPLIWSYKAIKSVKEVPVTEYFVFRDTMPLYYRYVNTLLSHIAVGMGIYGNGTSSTSGTSSDESAKVKDGSTGNGANMTAEQKAKYSDNMPAILKDGPDIFKIMCKRSERMGKSSSESTDSLLQKVAAYQEQPDNMKASMLGSFWSGLTTGALEGANFIGFRIDKMDPGESFSNSTQDSSLAGKLNGEVQAARDRNLGEMNGKGFFASVYKGAKKVKSAWDTANELVKSKGSSLESAIAYMAAGNGFYDLPKQWAGSGGMGRSLSFNMKLRAKTGGDNVSIFQSIMIPLSCLLAAGLPRAAGDSTYTSPFIVRAFCKGMFAIPAGIISSLSITRGSSEFGWSLNRLPTVVDVNFSIEDLSPMLFLSIAGNGFFQQAFANNTKLHEYLNTLTGIGCKERYFLLNKMKRRATAAFLISRNTTFSPTYWGFQTGNTALIRSIMALTPYHRVKNN